MSEITKKYLESFLKLAKKNLRENSVTEDKIKKFSDVFLERAELEIQMAEKFKPELIDDVEEFTDDVLRLTISDLDPSDTVLIEATGNLWGLRAEKALEGLERKEKGQSGHLLEFKIL